MDDFLNIVYLKIGHPHFAWRVKQALIFTIHTFANNLVCFRRNLLLCKSFSILILAVHSSKLSETIWGVLFLWATLTKYIYIYISRYIFCSSLIIDFLLNVGYHYWKTGLMTRRPTMNFVKDRYLNRFFSMTSVFLICSTSSTCKKLYVSRK